MSSEKSFEKVRKHILNVKKSKHYFRSDGPSTWEAEASELCELEASLVYKESSRTASAVT